MNKVFFQAAQTNRKLRYGNEMINTTLLRQRLIKEVTQLENRIEILERVTGEKHRSSIRNYRDMIIERLKILQDLFAAL